jgi:hypothetical protein
MKSCVHMVLAALAAVILTGCAGAAFNEFELTLNRNITVGQELMDLQEAHEKGVINDTEYMQAKKNLLHLVDELGNFKAKGK